MSDTEKTYVVVCKKCGDDLGITTDDLNKLFVPHELSDEEITEMASRYIERATSTQRDECIEFARAIIKATRGENVQRT